MPGQGVHVQVVAAHAAHGLLGQHAGQPDDAEIVVPHRGREFEIAWRGLVDVGRDPVQPAALQREHANAQARFGAQSSILARCNQYHAAGLHRMPRLP